MVYDCAEVNSMYKRYGITHPLLEKYSKLAEDTFCSQWASTERVLAIAERAQLSPENLSLLSDFLEYADDDLKRFMWLFYYIQYEGEEDFMPNIWELDEIPMPVEAEKAFPGCIKAVVYLLSWEHFDKWVKERGLPEDVSEAYFDRYRYMVSLNIVTHNTYGLCRLSPFLYGYSKPFMLRLGRLSYQVTPFKDYSELYENSAGQRIFAALPNYTYDQDGHQADEGWTPFREIKENVLTAHVFGLDGHLKLQPEQIDLNEYKRILSPEDLVVTIHIPEGGRLDPSQVQESLTLAHEVFQTYFPKTKTFVCQTWFIDPNLRFDVVKDGSNMAAFADLFDVISGPDSRNHPLFEHIFKVKPQPLTQLKPETGLQERILKRALEGKKMYWGFGVLKK